MWRPRVKSLAPGMVNFACPVLGRQPLVRFASMGKSFECVRTSEVEEEERKRLISEISRKLRGPLVDEFGNLPPVEDRPIAIEVDGPSHFYVNSTKYTAYTKLKHRLLTRLGYRVLHVPYFDWRKLKSAKEREDYMRAKLKEEPTEWLEQSDEKEYAERLSRIDGTARKPPAPRGPRPGQSRVDSS